MSQSLPVLNLPLAPKEGASTQAFLLACSDGEQEVKREKIHLKRLKAFSSQISKHGVKLLIILTFLFLFITLNISKLPSEVFFILSFQSEEHPLFILVCLLLGNCLILLIGEVFHH